MTKSINLTRLLKGVNSGWVALSSDYKKIVSRGKDYVDLNRKVKDLPSGSVYLMPIVKSFRNIVTANF